MAKITEKQVREELEKLRQSDIMMVTDSDLKFQELAAVLVWFEPEKLGGKGWPDYFPYCNPVIVKSAGNWWQLRKNIRQQALKRLGTKKNMLAALERTPQRTKERKQLLFESVLLDKSPDVEKLSRTELVYLSEILDWLGGFIVNERLVNSIRKAIPMADLLAPMHRLATENFIGRKPQLKKIFEYVNSPGTRRLDPLLIYGPGGVGKSSLVSKFILENVKISSDSMPFAYLDIDRAMLDPERPDTFIFEAARQLAIQLPEKSGMLSRFKDYFELRSRNFESFEISKSISHTGSAYYEFGYAVSRINTNVLLVIDTFEEAQFLGREVVSEIWQLLVSLQKAAPNIRIIVAGRSAIKDFPVQNLELGDLEKEEAIIFLKNSLHALPVKEKVRDSIIKGIIQHVGLNPLSLQLASAVVHSEGIEQLKTMSTRTWLLTRVKTEVIQARLYGRILAHIHDQDVKKMAYPGLIVRRINANVIMHILSEPCGLNIKTEAQAEILVTKLAREGALVEVDFEDGSLRHRQDVRRIMLTDLKNAIPAEIIKQIHEKAIAFYSKRNDVVSRAEHIYHLLLKGGSIAEANRLWTKGLDSRLRNALDELPLDECIWLSDKLGVTPDAKILQNADLLHWEEITARSVQRMVQSGNTAAALATLRNRSDRSDSSALYRLELELLRNLGLFDEAAFRSEEILSGLPASADPFLIREIFLQLALVNEAQDSLNEALKNVEEAEKINFADDNIANLRILITHIRLLRKRGDTEDNRRAQLIGRAASMLDNKNLLTEFYKSPALFRETVAELGKRLPEFLDDAVYQFGIEIANKEQMSKLAEALLQWDDALTNKAKSGLGDLARLAGLDVNNNNFDGWMEFIEKAGFENLKNSIQSWRKELNVNDPFKTFVTDFDKVLVDLFRDNVDFSINRTNTDTTFNM